MTQAGSEIMGHSLRLNQNRKSANLFTILFGISFDIPFAILLFTLFPILFPSLPAILFAITVKQLFINTDRVIASMIHIS